MNKNLRLFLMVACSSIASQIYVNMFVNGFIIALSVVMMGVFLYLFKDLNAVKACFLIGIFSPLIRLLIVIYQDGHLLYSAKLVLPDMGYFFSYAVFFGILFRSLGYTYGKFYTRLAISDFFSNCMEITVRFFIFDEFLNLERIAGLILLAITRSFFILLICLASDLYRSLLERTEHEENYRKLILMASNFNSEVYFMEKNMNEIEDVMKNAFVLYRTLERENYPKSLQHISLEIAKDIHEIKKGYRRVIVGLQDNFILEFKDTPLSLQDILKILSSYVNKSLPTRGLHATFSYSYRTNYMIEDHFALMGILRNLVSNAMDALEETPHQRGEITVDCTETVKNGETFCTIRVEDNGPGIPDDVIDVLFVPGFSTKYNEATGDINRGLGLSLVKDLLEDRFHGKIQVSTSSRNGTAFILTIPVSVFSEKENISKKSEYGEEFLQKDSVEMPIGDLVGTPFGKGV